MSKRPRRNHSPAFKAKVALAAVKGETLAELAQHLPHPFAGNGKMRDLLGQEGLCAGRPHVATLMKRIGARAMAMAAEATMH